MPKNNNHSVLVNGVVFKDNEVLISRRSPDEKHEPGRWTIPGGKVDESEEIVFNILEKTLKREIKEETGVEVKKDFQLVTNNNFYRSTGQHVVAIVFKCKWESGEPKPLDDTVECEWATKEEVRDKNFPPNVKDYILKAFKI